MNKTIPAFELFNEIGIINQLATTMFERVLPKGMTQAQFTVLNHFVRLGHQERSPAQLAFAFQVTRPTMTSTLSRMERAGLILVSWLTRPEPADRLQRFYALLHTPVGEEANLERAGLKVTLD